jgi:hypothetical protein
MDLLAGARAEGLTRKELRSVKTAFSVAIGSV